MKKLIGFILLLVAVGGGAYYYFVYTEVEAEPQIMTATVSQGNVIEAVSSTGTLEPVRTIAVGSQVSGIVQSLHADYNEIVRPGQVIAQIDPTLLQTQVEIQKANIARQEGDIENQRVRLQDAELQLTRAQQMHEKGLINDRDLEQARLTVLNQEASIVSAERSLVSARANLAQAELNVAYTTIKAPTEGVAANEAFVVVQRHVDIGQTVQSSMTTPQFFTLATDLRSLKLTAGVDEAEIGKVRPGQIVEFTVDTYGQQIFRGTVNSVRLNATSQSNVVTYPVWIDVPNPDLKLKPSMTATVDIIVRTAENTLRVPNQATRFRPTAETYAALKIPAPEPGTGNGRGNRGGGNANGGDPQTPAAGTPPAGREGGEAGAAGAGATTEPGRAGGAAVDPGAMAAVAERFGRGGGRQGGRGGGGGRQGGGRSNAAANSGPQVELRGTRIDDNFAELERTTQAASVWTWNEETRELREIRIRTGISDGTFSEIISGDVTAGMVLVTGVLTPVSTSNSGQQQNSIFNQGGGGRGDFGGGRGGGGGRGRD